MSSGWDATAMATLALIKVSSERPDDRYAAVEVEQGLDGADAPAHSALLDAAIRDAVDDYVVAVDPAIARLE